ncbi:E3 ubiquitin-protein ligase rnf213-alpha-like [Amphiura filiformis]|uniref:E3 ubiquitin-protein ligase rnf213-alpha-like n=1 Tax=Amphiura filiformis TaxID=82378 RepID=UPI003B21074E
MFVRMAGAEFGNMNKNTLEMRTTKTLKDKYLLFEGSGIFKTDQVLDKLLSYMYLVVKDGIEHWEVITNDGNVGAWHRSLQIHTASYNSPGMWTQYDWPVQMEKRRPTRTSVLGSRSSTFNKKYHSDHDLAVATYLPHWEGFVVTKDGHFPGQTNSEVMEVSHAIEQAEQVWNCLEQTQLRTVGTGTSEPWVLSGFDLQKSFLNFFADKIKSYKSKATIDINHDQLHSALAICYLIDQHSLPATPEQLTGLWDGLMLSPCSEDMCVTVLQSIRRQFGSYLKYGIKSLENQCKLTIQKCWKTGDHRWLLALPLLHFLRGDIKPYAGVDIDPEADYSDPQCWGLSGLSANKRWIQHADSGALIQMHKRIAHVCHSVEQDRLLPYAILWLLLTIKNQRRVLVDFQEHLPKKHKIHPFMLLHALDTVMCALSSAQAEPKSPSKHSSWDNKYLISDVGLICNAMVSFLKSNKFIFSNIGEKFINMSISVAQSAIALSSIKHYELVTRSFTLINLCIASLEQGERAEHIYAKIRLPTVELVEWLRQNLPAKFLDYNVKDRKPTFPVEWSIWKELFRMTFPRVFEAKWKQSLMKLFQDRLYNTVPDAARIRIAQFNTGHPELDHIVHQGAMDAMEKMLKEEKKEEPGILGRLRSKPKEELKSSDYEKVGDLMSELLKTSLPKDNQEQTEEEKWKTLQKVLDWKPIVAMITMSGTDVKTMLDSDANSGIHMVTNLITEMSQKLLDGTIQLRQLHAIVGDQERLKRFIEIYKTAAVSKTYNLGPDQGESTVSASDMDKLLQIRQLEFQAIEEKQPLTENFVEMCMALAPAIQVDTSSISSRAVFDVKSSEHTVAQHCTTATHRRRSIVSSRDRVKPVVKIVVPAAVMNVLQRLYDCNKRDSHVFRAICTVQIELASLNVAESRICSTVYAAREIWLPALNTWDRIRDGLDDGSITCDDIYSYFVGLSNSDIALREELCKFSKKEERVPRWLEDRVKQIQDLFHVQSSLKLAKILIDLIDILGLTQTRVSDIGNLEELAMSGSQSLRAISTANKISEVAKELSSVDSTQITCIEQVIHCQEVVKWIRNNMQDMAEFFDFIDDIQCTELETDAQFDALTAFSRAVDGYAPLIFDLKFDTASLSDVIKACQNVWKNLQYDRNMATVLRDSQKYLAMLQQFRQNRDYAQTTAMHEIEHINARGVYTLGTQPGNEGNDYYCKPNLELFQLMVAKDANNPESRAITYEYENLRDLERSLTLMSSNVTSKPEKQGQLDYFTEVISLVHQTATIYNSLCSAGCMFFREWGAKLYCFHYHAKPSIIAHFGTGKAISGSREIPRELADLRQFMEDCSSEWLRYISKIRSKYSHLNLYTNEQLLVIRQSLASLDLTGEVVPQVYTLFGKVKAGCMQEDVDMAMSRCQFSANKQAIAAKLNQALVKQGRKSSSIKDTFENLWQVYLKNITHNDLGKALSLEQLGMFFAYLAELEQPVQRRSFTFREGQPNLIQCESDDLLVNILSVYESDSTGDRLPGSEEVLLCNAETTVEEIDLLFRRAFDDCSGRIYCLGGPEVLKPSVSSTALNCFNYLSKDRKDSRYRLAIVYSNKRPVSPLLDALSKYSRQPEKQSMRPKVKKFLEQQLMQATLESQHPVKVLSSTKPGNGKSLEVTDRAMKLQAILIDNGEQNVRLSDVCITLPILGDKVDVDVLISAIWNQMPMSSRPQIFHFDISPLARTGLDAFLFQLLITGEITDSHGSTWRRRPGDQYIVEVTDLPINPKGSITKNRRFFSLLPCSTCYTPKEVYWQLHANEHQPKQTTTTKPETFENAVRFTLDNLDIKYASRHLWRLDNNLDLEDYSFEEEQATACQTLERAPCKAMEMIQTLLKHCGTEDPSWRALNNFAKFMTLQLRKCEASGLCTIRNLKHVGFKRFVVQFLARMAREFSSPWMKFQGQTQTPDDNSDDDNTVIYELLRTWNTSTHPYIFFNKEGEGTMSYYGCKFTPEGTLVDSMTGAIMEENMVSKDLMHGLKWNGINFTGDDDHNLKELCKVIGVRAPKHPDMSFKLTPDNVKRILAIHARLRFGLPVVILGERGCGKTRLIRYLSKLLAGESRAKNLMHCKIHGGTTASDINMCLTKAEIAEKLNRESYNVDTILYFDDANTTEAFDLIKEIIIDGRLRGHPIDIRKGSLKIIVACIPYRRNGSELIERVKSAGLGFNKFVLQRRQNQGPIPFGEMVYSVRPLPPSMLDFIWDFGNQDTKTEQEYILQMVILMVESDKLRVGPEEAAVVALILYTSHIYITKRQRAECGLVTLKDVNRCLDVLVWFHNKMPAIDAAVQRLVSPTNQLNSKELPMNSITKALVYSLAVCYYARLRESRQAFLEEITSFFNIKEPCRFIGGAQRLKREILICQSAFTNELHLPSSIAANTTLKENIFMMIVCIELRIPLFLIGKPGTSKSLAKTIIEDAMEGTTSDSSLFRTLKKVNFTTHQCNPDTTRKDINNAFEEAAMVWQNNKSEHFVSVVCLDELGLAEASPDAPLKILHPYLENVPEEEEEESYPPRTSCKNISFIGMSNWAVDMANINTGIVLILEDPNQETLIETAKELCPSSEILMWLSEKCSLIPALTKAFLSIMATQKTEYFGYPDFYNLIKMIVAFCIKSGRGPTISEVEHSIRRNFDRNGSTAQWNIFKDEMKKHDVVLDTENTSEDPYCTEIGLVKANVEMSPILHGQTRHMLIETDNYAAISILQDEVLEDKNPVLFFRSSFRLDNTYSQMCRNVNRIKRCMENGRIVVLVNHADLFECLHDVLNLHYVSFAGQNYVELALGTNRVKCRIHKDFRLIVVANRDVVNTCFTPPLLGRFEKHFLAASSLLTPNQKFIVDRLSAWVRNFAASVVQGGKRSNVDIQEGIVGYHPDVIPSLVHRECKQISIYERANQTVQDDDIFNNVQNDIIECATETAKTTVKGNTPRGYTSLENFLWTRLQRALESDESHGDLAQITTHSLTLNDAQLTQLEEALKLERGCIELQDMQQFVTETQFRTFIRKYFSQSRPARNVYKFLHFKDHTKKDLIACATHYIQDEKSLARLKDTKTHVILVIQMPPNTKGFTGFPGGDWISAHIPSLTVSSNQPNRSTTRPVPVPMPKTTRPARDSSPHGHMVDPESESTMM